MQAKICLAWENLKNQVGILAAFREEAVGDL